MKDHFVKIAVTILGHEKAREIIRHYSRDKKLSLKEQRRIEKEIFSCQFCETKSKQISVEAIKEYNYGYN